MSKFKAPPKPKTEADFVAGAPSVAMPAQESGEQGRGFIRVNMQLTTAQHETLRRLAFERRISMAEMMREALDEWLIKKG